VYGTLRNKHQVEAFEKISPGKTIPLLMDVTYPAGILNGVNKILETEGRIDVLVNNAGYGLFGAIEEVTMEEARAQMETNFFGALELTKAVLPSMRKQGSGHIFQISSVAGFRGTEGLGIYNASKFALEGFSQGLAKEVHPFGIKVTLVEPGPFRTEWGGRSSIRSKTVIPEYHTTAHARIHAIQTYSGTQPGDPDKAAAVILDVLESDSPPLHLPLGELAIEGFREKMRSLELDIKTWEDRSRATAFGS
jgi:NAD(P)-dependent dehydrogenase (short-subunit alcohol dehydrogenase family)